MHINQTILLVDDDPDDRTMLEQALKTLETKQIIVEAHDGIDCLQKLHELAKSKELPCLIVLDINMPRMDGRQTFSAIKEEHSSNLFKDIPIVIFSTSSAQIDKDFFSGKAVEYMQKPIQFQALLEVARKILVYCDEHRKQRS